MVSVISDETSPAERAILDRCDLCLVHILGVKDRIKGISDQDAARLRSVVMREVNELTNLAVAMVRATIDGGTPNELYINMIREIHSAVVAPSE